jgi:glycosyltransferase involved in cell wall biosynthesis
MSTLHRCRTRRDPSGEPLAIPLPQRMKNPRARTALRIRCCGRAPDDTVRHFDEGWGHLFEIIHPGFFTLSRFAFQQNSITVGSPRRLYRPNGAAVFEKVLPLFGPYIKSNSPVFATFASTSDEFYLYGGSMRIAQVAPLYESVPPKLYGGTERVVHYLTESLVKQGHEVTLFASGDSSTNATLVPICSESLRLGKSALPLAHHVLMLEQVRQAADDFDVIHFHCDFFHFPISRRQQVPHVTTLHGRLDIPELVPLYEEFRDMPVISISNSQRVPLPWVNWQRTVYHGLPRNLYRPGSGAGNYLAFLGRISPEKRIDRAIEIAKRSEIQIKIAAKVDPTDQEYFDEQIRPLLLQPGVEFIGEIGDGEKSDFLGNAMALLFPIDWPEPFGLVVIESLACATPVIAWNCGSVPELIADRTTGFVVNSIEQAVAAVEQLDTIERRRCREVFEKRFSVERMTVDYVSVYWRLQAANRLPVAIGSE